MKRNPFAARVQRPKQIEIGGLAPDPFMQRTWAKRQRKHEREKSWEDDFAFQVQEHRLPQITRKFLFAKQALGRRWEADFAYPDLHLLIEIDGGVWRRGGGAHSHPSNIERDIEKSNDAALLGYCTLRFTSTAVRNGTAIAFLLKVLHDRGWTRHEHRTTSN